MLVEREKKKSEKQPVHPLGDYSVPKKGIGGKIKDGALHNDRNTAIKKKEEMGGG